MSEVSRIESIDTQQREDRLPPLVYQIVRSVTKDIIEGRYRPGDPIREQEIASRLNVSRAPVREAFRLLAMDGMVEMLPWRGVRVVVLRPQEVTAVFELTAALMGVAARLEARVRRIQGSCSLDRQAVRLAQELARGSGDGVPRRTNAGENVRQRAGARPVGQAGVADLLARGEVQFVITVPENFSRCRKILIHALM